MPRTGPPTIPAAPDHLITHNAVLADIDPRTGAQHYRWGDALTDCVWLAGIDRHPTATVGDRGSLIYEASHYYGRYRFVRNED